MLTAIISKLINAKSITDKVKISIGAIFDHKAKEYDVPVESLMITMVKRSNDDVDIYLFKTGEEKPLEKLTDENITKILTS